jgi:hypothetical protein
MLKARVLDGTLAELLQNTVQPMDNARTALEGLLSDSLPAN